MKRAGCVLLLLILLAPGLRSQTTNGSIEGTVSDPSGAVIPGATVTARNLDTALTVTVKTTDAGLYSIPNLPPGNYSTVVDGGSGLKKYEFDAVLHGPVLGLTVKF